MADGGSCEGAIANSAQEAAYSLLCIGAKGWLLILLLDLI
jgi:hypothetical protein